MRKQIRTIPKRAMDAMRLAPWPGNIRELENFIERCVILTPGEELNVPLSEVKRTFDRVLITKPSSAGSTLLQAERQVIIDALKSAAGKVAGPAGAAERLGVKRTTLQNKIRRLNIGKSDYLTS
jgi:formate hydrogenlyase transcriptional activator